jgi:hypothetical protein
MNLTRKKKPTTKVKSSQSYISVTTVSDKENKRMIKIDPT